ncbi:bifunctional protein-disulfide isomerase/oxidoreductase DsbC [Shewanella yunxiaonensis]|uniref:Thiol:disulfide interchange protein n=1 Tax=Shewanella yunxiaonensis TaxID=2829809 RepID=A0ABX7YRQ2_9GAMM|nr:MULTISPECIES: bifunctional protein-disulfide isomerase/oxidoreductase DsbC [Shewanella]MDF0534010.1 bifunctional protein-disulfide isomerase/oxidoreductase DsbC [Shewanella sp. A32]QUN05198.1 bifunctional protein-disulfide isomerase/oxidoreductase DsbC [Shewanella yunxiaonensis]
MKLTRTLTLCLALAVTPLVHAASSDQNAQLKQRLTKVLGIKIQSLSAAPIPGLLQAITSHGVLYVTEDGSKLFHGNIYDVNNDMEDLTEAAMAGPRLEMLKPFESKMLVYKAKNEKHVVTVFTDVTCGYCRKLHSQMEQYNDLGITIRYLAYPRQGVPSAVADEMESVWCSKDPKQAMNDAEVGKKVLLAKCDADIASQYQLGEQMGVNGTPSMILSDGTMVPGYLPPKQLLQSIEMH